ncbi:MAG TPA: S8 family serine peptidase [Gemmatimonadota bacterium]|nr:S8 family serine peptidase [Gemmatimonadota bacterium]
MRIARGLLATFLVVALAGAGVPAGPTGARERVIIRLADRSARLSLMASVRGPAMTLDLRHERVVTGLRAIHAASYRAVGDALADARSQGALTELDRLWIVNAVVAEIDSEWVERLAADPAVAEIVPDRRITLGAAVAGPVAADATASQPADDLVRIRVPEVWAQGLTGRGAIVANVDSGVNGEDDTFGDRWRGRLAGSDATWFAPVSLTVFPEDDFSIGSGHGTATLGVMTGGDETYGVAFDATWIAADVFDEGEGYVSNVLKSFEWLSDPDGDPTTFSDVPDVVNNSYGLTTLDDQGQLPCDMIFDDAIDALEAAGAIVVWSAGNEGPLGITSPAGRADSPVNAFAVGSVNANDQVSLRSGRGPSACGGAFATKPEVVAPGENVTTRNLFNQFTSVSGTSFATPMAAGVLAIMRSKNPQLTPEGAKTILLETARDLGAPGDDNETGRGMIDAAAALAQVEAPAQPIARLIGFRPGVQAMGKLVPAGIEDALVLSPGATHVLAPVLTNHGPAIPATTATLSSPTAGVTVTDATVELAAAGTGDAVDPGADTFELRLEGSVEAGSAVVLEVAVQGAPVGPFRMIIKAGQPIARSFATHDEGDVRLTVTNFGGLGFYTGLHQSGFRLVGDGFRFPADGPNRLFHGGFLAGVAADRLSDAVPYGEDTQNSTDWFPLPGAELVEDRAFDAERIVAEYDDRHAIRPLGLQVRQESFAFGGGGGEGAFVILQYVLTNKGSQNLGGVRSALFLDWDLPGTGSEPAETAGWDPGRRLGFVEGSASEPALGVVWLDDAPIAQIGYATTTREEVVESTLGNPTNARTVGGAEAPDLFAGEFSDAEKWELMTSGQSRTTVTQPADVFQLIGRGPLAIAAGATDTVAVALVAGDDRTALQAAAETARAVYFERILGQDPPGPGPVPGEIELAQNFPNPFRAGGVTTIPFSVPAGSDGRPGRLIVYDLLGRRVRILLDEAVGAGERAATWDGRADSGAEVAAGVYVARLSIDGTDRTIRILVVP